MNKVKIGILGCASIAERYAIRAFQHISNSEVVSVASRDPRKAKTYAEKFSIPQTDTYESLFANKNIDAVYIPLPIGLHREWIIQAAKAGKHVLSEKSLASDLQSVKEIIEVCKENNVVLYENFTCDYHPQHHAVKEIMENGKIGKPRLFQSLYGFPIIAEDNFRYNKDLGGSALYESGAYQVYTVRKLFGAEPISASAELFTDPKRGVDMNGEVILDFGNDLKAMFSFNLDAVYQNTYSIWGTKGLVKVGRAYAIAPDFKPIVELTTNENRKDMTVSVDVPAHNHFETIFSEFCDLVLDRTSQAQKKEKKYADILAQAKVLEAIRISARENRRVGLSEIE